MIQSREANWEKLSAYFRYSEEIRRMIYTTNAVEDFHRDVGKVTKTKGVFTSDMALLKLVYLAMKRISEKRHTPINGWGLLDLQLAINFGDRMPLALTLNQT